MVKSPFVSVLLVAGTLVSLFSTQAEDHSDMSVNPIILDMDFCTDVDDAVSVRMATVLDANNVGTLKAVGLCVTDAEGAGLNVKALHGILCNDGYGDTPIGTSHTVEPDGSPYWGVCAEYSDGVMDTRDAVELYKDVLRECYYPVTIVTTGYMNNIEHLLKDKEGYKLIEENCKRLVVTGGTYPSGWDNNFCATEQAAASIRYVNDNAPCEIVYVANDVGGPFTAGGVIQRENPNDPVARAVTAWGSNDGRAAWDPVAVYIAFVQPVLTNFDYVNCKATFESTGVNIFTDSETYTGRVVVRRKESVPIDQYKNYIEGILSSVWYRKSAPIQ